MKIKLRHFIAFSFLVFLFSNTKAQTLSNYINEAKKNYTSSFAPINSIDNSSTTQLNLGYFVNPQYTISGAQRAYVELQQEIPWLGKANAFRKLQKNYHNKRTLKQQQELEQLSFLIKERYYKMYQYLKQKEVYVTWADELRKFIATPPLNDSLETDSALAKFKHQTKLVDITKQLQIVDGDYQNEVIIFNELLKSETLDEPQLPLVLAMPEEEVEFQFPDPYESASYLQYENEITEHQYAMATQNPWSPKISLGLRYINVSTTKDITFRLPTKDIFEPQLRIKWNLFAKKAPRLSNEETNQLLDHKISTLSHQLQIALNNQISARIAYDAATEQIETLHKLEEKLRNSKKEISAEKKLQINSLKYTFEIQQIKAVSDYYITTSKMLLYF